MYEELIAALRFCDGGECDGCCRYTKEEGHSCYNLLRDAADAIEELSKPRWIPVTERLPEENQIVVVHEGKGTWDFGMFRGISASGNPEYWHWKKNTFKRVKWWMPKDGALPELPKEGT